MPTAVVFLTTTLAFRRGPSGLDGSSPPDPPCTDNGQENGPAHRKGSNEVRMIGARRNEEKEHENYSGN
jgi:hypothetical protein